MDFALAVIVFLVTLAGTLSVCVLLCVVLPINRLIIKGEKRIMAKLDDVKAAIETAKAAIVQAVTTEVGQVNAAVVALKDSINVGNAATPADLDAIIDLINNVPSVVNPAVDAISDSVK